MNGINTRLSLTKPLLSIFARCLYLPVCLSVVSVPGLAASQQSIQPLQTETIENVQQTNTQVVQSIESHNALENRAKMWGLSTVDYKHYRWLMKHTPSKHWYKNLDPAEVLALNASDKIDMMKYAKIQARNMHAKVTRELAFSLMYTKAYKEEYPNEQPIMSPNQHTFNSSTLKSGDHIWLFVGRNTPLAGFAYQKLIKAVQAAPGTTLDIYFVGKSITSSQIQAWATTIGIPHDIVNKQVTLNYGNARYATLSKKGKHIHLPYVGVVHNKNFQPISLSSVL